MPPACAGRHARAVAEDTGLAVVALDHDQQREQVVGQQCNSPPCLSPLSRAASTPARTARSTSPRPNSPQRSFASLRCAPRTRLHSTASAWRAHRLPPTALSVDSNFPASPISFDATVDTTVHGYANSAVAAAFDNAKAKQQQAWGDARFRFRPQVNFFAQYNYYATFSDSFAQLQKIYQANTGRPP